MSTAKSSVLIACVGDAFMEGCAEAVNKARDVYAKTGGKCEVLVQPNITVMPPLGLGAMHNFQIQRACVAGFDYVMLLHNDVLLDDPEILIELVGRGKQFITPWFDQSPMNMVHKIAEPMYRSGQGVLRLDWTVPYCTLYDTAVFKVVGYRPFCETMIYCQDEYDSMLLRNHGIQLWQDTDHHVKLLRGPKLLADNWKFPKICLPFEKP